MVIMKEALENIGRFAIDMMNLILLITYVLVKITLVHAPRLFLAAVSAFISVFFEMPLNVIGKKLVLLGEATDE